jgi:septal ring factor EnvC (AmiA/AmiB activator)
MSQDLTQWIAEVRTLQRQLADTQKERDQAYNSAANWRRLYETEARQRREEAAEFQTQIDALQQRLDADPSVVLEKDLDLSTVNSLQGLQQRLDGLVQQCQDLTQKLQAEQAAHAQTRQTLTAALGDTFDALK